MGKIQVSNDAPGLFPPGLKYVFASVGSSGAVTQVVSTAEAYPLIELPAGAYVYDVAWQVVTAFNSDVDLSIGTTDDADGFAEVADVAATVADTNVISMRGLMANRTVATDTVAQSTAPAYAAHGYVAPSSGTAINVTVATTAVSAGLLNLYVFYIPPSTGLSFDYDRRRIAGFNPGLN